LSKRFSDNHGPDRENPKHYMKILADGEDILRMIESINLGEAEHGGDKILPDFTKWMLTNDGRQAEIASGQHRKEALRMHVENVGLGEEELWWPCEIYDRGEFYLRHCTFPSGIVTVRQTKKKNNNLGTLTIEQNLQLRANRRDVAKPDSNGDVWLQAVAAESQRAGIFHGSVEDMKEQMGHILQLHGEASVPLPRLVTLWRNDCWKMMATRLCNTVIGRVILRISTLVWMISCRIDEVSAAQAGKWLSITDKPSHNSSGSPSSTKC
jgi:hypothetical protein